jgi:hypothetical protein
MEKGCSRLSLDLAIGTSHSLASRLPYYAELDEAEKGRLQALLHTESYREVELRSQGQSRRGFRHRSSPSGPGCGFSRLRASAAEPVAVVSLARRRGSPGVGAGAVLLHQG